MSSSRLNRMATVALDDGALKRSQSKDNVPTLEGTKNLHLNPDNTSFVIQDRDSAEKKAVKDDESEDAEMDEDEDEDDSAYDCFSTRNPVAQCIARFFGGSPTPAFMSMFVLTLFLLMTFQNLTADSRSSALAMAIYFGINTGVLLAVFMFRAIWLKILYWIFEENRIVPALNEIIDPDLPILIWTLCIQMIWASNMAQVFDGDGRKTGYHRIKFLPEEIPFQDIKDKQVTYIKLMHFVLIFWAVRNLLVEIIMFNILLGFLTNFRDSVLSYLSEYALLRKLNANWVKVVPQQDIFTVTSPVPPPPPTGMRLSRRHSSIGMAFEEALARKPQAQPDTQPQPQHAKRMLDGTPWDKKRKRRERALHVQYTGRALPTVLQNKNIKSVQQSALANLLSITFIRLNPMVLFVHGERCELKSKRVAKAVARLLFREIKEFQHSVNQIEQDLQRAERQAIADENAAFAAFQTGSPMTMSPLQTDGSKVDHTRTPGAVSPKPPKPKVKINVHENKITFADRLAAELGVRNEEGQEDDETDEDVSDGENFKTIQEAVEGKAQHPRILSPPTASPVEIRSVPALQPEPEAAVQARKDRARHKTAPAPGMTQPLDFHVPLFEKRPYARLETEASGEKAEEAGPQTKQFTHTASHGSTLNPADASSDSEPNDISARRETWRNSLRAHLTTRGGETPVVSGVRMTREEVDRIVEQEIRAVKKKRKADEKHRISKEFFSLFMSRAETESLMAVMDPGKNGSVSEKMFVKGVLNVHQKRRQMTSSLEAQKEIIGVFHRVTTYFLTFIMFLVFLIIAGVSTNTIIVSGAAALSASGVVLSFVYTDFIISIILIVFLNPYSIGDGIVLNGVFMTVRRITTYFTECVQGDGKIFYVSHKKLTETGIINQSRGPNACFGLTVRVGDHMTAAQYDAFKRVIEAYLASRPDMYKPDLFIHWLNLEPWHYIDLNMWITGMESWAAPGTWIAKSDLFAFVLRQTHILGLTYKGVIQRWEQYRPDEDRSSKRDSELPPPADKAIAASQITHTASLPTPPHSTSLPTPPRGVMFLDLTQPIDTAAPVRFMGS
eukprot:Blabericola_migrator_1__6910@NODE_34_length_18107_cov_55_154712_g30_i0_p2_GENE_NODE_34_length_18107_cov_55_154712_g30_i0NODE_34_length_18107_cov_55_154712_g30_i0_p2_ORF_typecomplete_len1068_score281_12MS_channel/PF00924_18/9_4e03MS_channel/PF00924_18/1_3e19DUF4271/PF14093_6/0_00029DUF4271/PF14093_6/6_2e02DUF4271/PF14093_6/1_9e03EFhand_8/PF13833_6/0_64Tweety/PF04906_13/4_8e02Tweety/PF04906_13/0_51DNA_pol_phi/PF04931_13/22DNA_pol_phi/PF04931_13/15_NODE_34_length_18107_cov_55_154712_g30_i010614264